MKLIWIAAYVASVLLANLTLDRFIPLPVFGLLSVGTLFFSFVFTLRDKLHQFGLRTVFLAIGMAVVVNALAGVFLDTPVRFLFASFVAILFSELADTAVYQRLLEKTWLTRVFASNAISVPLDSILFTLLAFYGMMSGPEIVEIIYADILVKMLIAGVLALILDRGQKLRSKAAATS